MKFSELYKKNKEAVKDTLTAMWCASPKTERQKLYAEQLRQLIDKELFASDSYMPLVQCMDPYESVHSVSKEEAIKLVGGLWKSKHAPYEHQYKAWKALTNEDGPKKSMVVTTGTGSGKTECFMLPLVNDLLKTEQRNEIQAIFLYPLNALMEDQKERLYKLLKGTDLKFAVYNGNMPEDGGSENSKDKNKRRLAERIAEEKEKFGDTIISTRVEMHKTFPNIILTNPTMLEYMLLRQKDQKLFTPKSLRWIVIDETHTFSGAGAAELSMLIRRVLNAFDLDAKDVRFATSSATIGNAQSDDEQKENDQKLRQFISDITGAPLPQVKLITGKRIDTSSEKTDPRVKELREKLGRQDYVYLNDLIKEGNSIEEKLAILDSLCELPSDPLKAKLHFFFRVPNNGLRIQLDDHNNGTFNVKSKISADNNQSPYLELMRCEHCGEYFAIGESTEGSSSEYRALTKGGDDMFAFDNDEENPRRMIFGLTDKPIAPDEKNGDILVRIEGKNCYTDSNAFNDGWSIIQNTQSCCPHCHSQVIGNKKRDNEKDTDEEVELTSNAMTFRLPASFISRVLAPSILPQLRKADSTDNNDKFPHQGQQYISFVDSRQSAASATMQQNLEEERMWLYSRLFHALNKKRLQNTHANTEAEINSLQAKIIKFEADPEMADAILMWRNKIASLQNSSAKVEMSWMEIHDFLYKQDECEWLAYQFINKSENSDELDIENDQVDAYTKNKYVHSIMVELLGRRPRQAMAPETMGILATSYPKISKIKERPQEVLKFNESLAKSDSIITLEEWKNLLKIYLDFVVRSRQSIYLKLDDGSSLDIFSCQRFGTTKPARRPAVKPMILDDAKYKNNYSSIVLILASLIKNPSGLPLQDVAYNNRSAINGLLDALWKELTETTKLLQPSQSYKSDHWEVDEILDEDGEISQPYRLNVTDISFIVPDHIWLCDSRYKGETTPVLRPVDTIFMGLSPYTHNSQVELPAVESKGWNPFPFINGEKDGKKLSFNEINDWAKKERKVLWEKGIWGDYGIFSNRLTTIYSFPDIFVQAEHTAQVDKLVSRHSQDLFKKQKINILACSTTMEMGVDLGNLELVMMSSVPPHPSNYKQRAGRSGRNDDTRSACITLCGSDAVGLRTLEDPMNQMIKRQMAIPFVDLKSPQVIQRHANAFLFRASGIFFKDTGDDKNNLGQEVIDFFTPFMFDHEEKIDYFSIRRKDANATEVYPDDGLGNEEETNYYSFKKYLEGDIDKNNPENDIRKQYESLSNILKGTCFENDCSGCVGRCKTDIIKVYDTLSSKIGDIGLAYKEERDRLRNSKKPEENNLVKGNGVRSGYGYVLRHKFSEILASNMLTFLATNRFTPNANMPVEVIEFNVNLKNECTNNFGVKKSNNPSYALQEAISQYAPGNTIVLENRTSVTRGILYTGQYKKTKTFKRLYSDGNNTVLDFEKKLNDSPKEWPVSGKTELVLIEPESFIPDINEDYSRVIEKNSYTQVSAQLIGAGLWQGEENSTLIAMRSNRDCCDAKILYYNEGLGSGYCFCQDCGKTVIERSHFGKKYDYPQGMNDQTSKKNGKAYSFHYRIDRKDMKSGKGKRIECRAGKIMRNVILGGLIQTDYCEIKIKTDRNGSWVSRSKENDKLLITLGILLTKGFTDYIGKDRKDVSFAIMPNGHLCIFDTNPGGSGYSNQLAGQRVMTEVITLSKKLLDNITSKDSILDKYTIRYLDKIDIEQTKKWLALVLDTLNKVPDNVKSVYPSAKPVFYEDILHDIRNRSQINEIKTLFVNKCWNRWNYSPDGLVTNDFSMGLKQRFQEIRSLLVNSQDTRICIVDSDRIPTPIYNSLSMIEDWAKVYSATNFLPAGFYPAAVIGNTLYFTTEESSIDASFDWGRNLMYSVSIDNLVGYNPKRIDVTQRPARSSKFVLSKDKSMNILSNELGGLIKEQIPDIVQEFFVHCKSHKDEIIKIKYQDEHLKSIVGMITTLQFIEHYMALINHEFVVKFVNEEYYEVGGNNSIASNILNDIDRNEKLMDLAEEWKDAIAEKGLICNCIDVKTEPKRTLPHWRSLVFTCAGKELCIYPNGGIINEWFLDKRRCTKFYTESNTSVYDNIPLFRNKEIMYDAEIKENN